jgi:hypothetical protein
MATVYRINGKQVSRVKFLKQKRGLEPGVSMVAPPGNWPMTLWAAGVHPDQIKEAQDYCGQMGVSTHYNADGDPIITSQGHFKKFCRANGLFDKLGSFSPVTR